MKQQQSRKPAANLGPGKRFGDCNHTIPFACLGSDCPNTCCGPFLGTQALDPTVSQKDLGEVLGEGREVGEMIQRRSVFTEIRLIPKDIERLQGQGLDHLIVRRGAIGAPAYYLRLQADGTCMALSEDNLCTIHPFRPTLCRAFPFYIDLFAGLSMIRSCPGVGAGETDVSDLKNEIRAAVEMYDFWMDLLRRNDYAVGDCSF